MDAPGLGEIFGSASDRPVRRRATGLGVTEDFL